MVNLVISEAEYTFFTGHHALADFETSAMLAQQIIDAHTLHAFVGCDVESLPGIIKTTYKQAVAVQTMAISQRGGISGSTEENYSSFSIGRFSMSGKTATSTQEGEKASTELLSPAAKALLPMLTAYGRGMRS